MGARFSRRCSAVAVMFVCLLLNFYAIFDLGMDLSMPPWVVDAMQVVLAANRAKHAYDYTGLVKVRHRFHDFLTDDGVDTLNDRIRAILREGPLLRGGETYRASCDDK